MGYCTHVLVDHVLQGDQVLVCHLPVLAQDLGTQLAPQGTETGRGVIVTQQAVVLEVLCHCWVGGAVVQELGIDVQRLNAVVVDLGVGRV